MIKEVFKKEIARAFLKESPAMTFSSLSLRGAKRRSNLKRDCHGFPKGSLAMTKG
jgi:hypothetical protein